jgi:hypothetical protein
MAIEPKNTREHILSLYGHISGVKKDLYQIKNNHLKHMHEDLDKLGGKIDKIYWFFWQRWGPLLSYLLKNFYEVNS